MSSRKIGRNEQCPCGSGVKFKKCCDGKVDWASLEQAPLEVAARHMTVRGKILVFFSNIISALKIDKLSSNFDFAAFKRAVSPEVVCKVFSVIPSLWPDISDFERAVELERSNTTALYTGSYEPESVFRAITRLSLYCDRILLVDPFIHAERVRPEYSPLEHPEQHRATTIKFLFLWMTLWPWIEAGIVLFIRPLHDFIPGLWHEILNLQKKRFEEQPKLKNILEIEVKERMANFGSLDRGMGELYLLSMSDYELVKMMNGFSDNNPFKTEKQFLSYIQKRRDSHPYFVERLPGQTAEFHHESTGACYELAKRMCSITNSHIVTNKRYRWKEIELDRESAGIDIQGWSPFAKALQNADFKSLDEVPIDAALQLRKEQRLESMRHFFRRVWRDCSNPEEFSDANAVDLAAQLTEEVAIANEEWCKIDRDLLKWLGGTCAALVSSGFVGFVPAASAAAITGVTGLIDARIKRSSFKERYPAGFFLGKSIFRI